MKRTPAPFYPANTFTSRACRTRQHTIEQNSPFAKIKGDVHSQHQDKPAFKRQVPRLFDPVARSEARNGLDDHLHASHSAPIQSNDHDAVHAHGAYDMVTGGMPPTGSVMPESAVEGHSSGIVFATGGFNPHQRTGGTASSSTTQQGTGGTASGVHIV